MIRFVTKSNDFITKHFLKRGNKRNKTLPSFKAVIQLHTNVSVSVPKKSKCSTKNLKTNVSHKQRAKPT